MKIVQYIFVRSDIKEFKKGSIAAQACHASVAAITKYKSNEYTMMYLEDIENMTKVILKVSKS